MQEDEKDEELQALAESDRGGPGGHKPTRIGGGAMPPIQSVCCACRKIVDDASPVLPHMGAYVCAKCAKQGKQRPIKEAEISNKVLAPWADSELAALIEYQASDVFLPFICAEGHRLVARKAELVCLQCSGFRLRWTYPWVLNGDWKKEL